MEKIRVIEWLEDFSVKNSNDISFDLYKNFTDSEESLKKYWDAFSDFYYISCTPFKNDMENWNNIPEIYNILKRCIHMANGHPLEILIGKYSDESMKKAKRITEKMRKEYEWTGITVWNPKAYMYLVGFFGGTSWRNNQEIIKEIKAIFPDKIKIIKAK